MNLSTERHSLWTLAFTRDLASRCRRRLVARLTGNIKGQDVDNLDKLESRVSQIGRGLVCCPLACEGVRNDIENGYMPRCLVLQRSDRANTGGAAVVGMNPGRSRTGEREHYKRARFTYESVQTWFATHGIKHQYHQRLLRLLDSLGVNGPILWTELPKCENLEGYTGPPPLQTFRTCTAHFLQDELKAIPETWPIFGIGREAFKALAYRFPRRTVLGVPHPTGSYGHFSKLLSESQKMLPSIKADVQSAIADRKAIWMSNDIVA